MPRGFGRKLKMKSGDKKTVVRGDLTATGWKEK
jgi:hypothetical protein